jgi:tetratricopeptide (TPR) repeat protein
MKTLNKSFSLLAVLVMNSLPSALTPPVNAATTKIASSRCSAATGQALIEQGRYDQAVREFTCVIESDPTEVEGYRGRIEALVLLGRYADAVCDYARVTAFVLPAHPDGWDTIRAHYDARLAAVPNDLRALTGASFARWWFFEYTSAIQLLNHLLELQPDNGYANLFRGSSRLLKGVTQDKGVADIERALALAPAGAHTRFIVADAYTYGLPDPQRAFTEANLALAEGLNTPRLQAILASAYEAFGDSLAAATHTKTHIDMVTAEFLSAPPLAVGGALSLGLVPGRTYEVSLPAVAGQRLCVATSSRDFYDTIAVLLAPDGTPVVGADDVRFYFAEIDWVAPVSGTYRLQVTSFESVNTGTLNVTRN